MNSNAYFPEKPYLCTQNHICNTYTINTMNKSSFLTILCTLYISLSFAQNPFLPLWEHVPDAEPYVFEDPDNPGHHRVYVYGSHDVLGNAYCGRDQVVWSAPVEDLTDWRYEGVSFTSVYDRDGNPLNPDGEGDILFAPDVAMRMENGKPVYYLYPNTQAEGRYNMVAKSDRPAGLFTVCNWSADDPKRVEGIMGFDPAVFVDEDGRVYGYWGFDEAYCAELDPATMATLKPGMSIHRAYIPSRHESGIFRFYEASSMRKIEDKYILIYSRWTAPGEFDMADNNYTLAYAYSDSPLGPFTYGGTLIDGRAPENGHPTAHPHGNTHGSIFCIKCENKKMSKCENTSYFLVYHRQTGYDEYHRQTMAAPLEVHVERGKGGKVTIAQAEYTSEGFRTQGLDPRQPIPAALACYYTGGAVVVDSLVTNIRNGSVVGYKYLNFDDLKRKAVCHLSLKMVNASLPNAVVRVRLDNPLKGKEIGHSYIKEAVSIPLSLKNISGKHALFFIFESEDETFQCEMLHFVIN